MSIVDPPRSFTRNGLQVSAVVDGERKAPTPKWDENEHPRDREGKFIETFARVRVWGGKLATVLRNVGGGRIQVQYDDKSKATLHRNYLTVVQRPNGAKPTSKRDASVGALPQQQAEVDAIDVPAPKTGPDADTSDLGETLEVFLRRAESGELADRVLKAAQDYQAAAANGIPDDEADERARLIEALDQVDSEHGSDKRISAISSALRAEALKEPEGTPEIARQQANDEPVTVRERGPRDPGVPISAPPETEAVAARTVRDGDVLHTRMGRVTVVGEPEKQPNQSYVLRLDRGDGKPPVEMTVRSRDRVDREVRPAEQTAPPAPPAPPTGAVGAPGAQRIAAGRLTDTPAAPSGPETRKYRTSPVGAREAAYADEVLRSDGVETGMSVDGQIVTITEPNWALFTLDGIYQIHVDNLFDAESLPVPERRRARDGQRALGKLMDAIRADYGIQGAGHEGPEIGSTPNAPETPDVPETPETPDVPETPETAAARSGRRQLDGFTPGESAMIHNAVEDHAATYYGGSLAMSTNDAARYTAEGHLKDLIAEHGLPKVWEAVAAVIADDRSVLTRSQEDRDRNKAERAAKLDELNRAAGAAAQLGNWDRSLGVLDEMETVDPTFRPGGLAIDDLRGRLIRTRDKIPDSEAGRAGETETVRMEDIQVGDVLRYGGEDYTVTVSEEPGIGSARYGTGWTIEAATSGGRRLHRTEGRDWTWQRVRKADEPTGQPDADETAAPQAAETTSPEAPAPVAGPAEPRFSDINAVREWLRNPDSIPDAVRNDPERAETARTLNSRIADDPRLTMSPGGRLMIHRNAKPNGDKEWRITSPANGLWLGPQIGTGKNQAEALRLAERFEAHVDENGQPFPFDAPDVANKIKTWRSRDGDKIGPLLAADRERVAPGRTQSGEWNDPWWREETPQTSTPAAPPAPGSLPAHLPTQRDAARYIAAQVGDPNIEPALRAALSPTIRRTGGMNVAEALFALERHPDADRIAPYVMTASVGTLKAGRQRVSWDGERARAALARLADGDTTLPAASVGTRVRLSVLDQDAPIRLGRPAAQKNVDGVVEDVSPTSPRGYVHVVIRGDDGERHVETYLADGALTPAPESGGNAPEVDAPAAPEVTPNAPEANAPDNAVTVDSLDDSRGGIGRDRSQWYRIDWDNDRDNAQGLYADNPASNRPIQIRATHGASDSNSESPQPGDRRVLFTNDQGASGDLVLPSGTRLIPVDAPETNAPQTDQDWEEIGRQAFRDGGLRAPAANAQVQDALADREVGDPETVRIMQAFSRGWDAENNPENIDLPDTAEATPGAEPDADVDVPAVPPADAEPSAPATPRAPGDGRWNIAPVETTGDEETDKRALAASLRAAARAAATPEDRAALNWAARQLDPPKPRPRPATDGSAPAPRRRASSPRAQARAQADSDVAVARRTRKPPVSPEARMAALADLADELDRLGLGSIAVTSDGGDGGESGGRRSLVTVLRQYVAEYKQRRAETAGGAGGGTGATTEGGSDGSDSGSGRGALQEVPAEDVPGADGPGAVLPGTGDGGGAADRRPDGSVRGGGDSEPGRDVPGEDGSAAERPAAGRGVGDAGDRAAGPGDGGDRGRAAGDRVPAEPGPDRAAGDGDAGGPAVGRGDERVPGRDRGTGGDQAPAADAEPVIERSDDAGEAPDGVTEADQPAPDPAAVPAAVADGENFRPTGVEDFAPAGKTAKLNANLQALRTLRQLQREKRPATPDEQAILAKWAGWGGLPEVFDPARPQFEAQRQELRGLLSDKEWDEARRNTLNAHYTDARVVESVWDAVRQLGFDGGRVLEPGSGSGTFIGLAPDNAQMVGVELDSTTAALSQYLYPNATIRNESFARTNLPDDSFDMTIGNVPFGKFALTDRRHNRDRESIHNHFILKSMDLTRPGGLVAVLTSRYTLDSQDSKARRKMADKADLVGAVRLPTGSHQRASGTDVIEDLLIFRVRGEGETPQADQSWVTASKRDVNGFEIAVNNYWDEHPENVLGEITAEKGQYGTGDLIVRGDRDMTDLPDVLAGIVEGARENGLTATASTGDRPDLVDADESRHDGHIRQEEDGTFTQAVNGASVPFDVPASQREELGELVGLRDTLSRLLDAEAANRANTPQITALRQQLNTQYDAYVAKRGPINRFKLGKTGNRIRPGQGNFRRDPMSAIVRALETYDPATGTATKASIFTKRAVAPRELRTSTDSPTDAVSLSMDAYGEVNLPAIADMLGVDETEARERLGNLVFEEPPTLAAAGTDRRSDAAAGIDRTGDTLNAQGIEPTSFSLPEIDTDAIGAPGRLEPAAAYLSGNVRKKLAIAQAAAAIDPRFQANVDALQAVIPEDLTPQEIDGRLGAAWIDAPTVQQFLRDLVDDRYGSVQVVNHGGSIWTVEGPKYGNLATEVWGTEKRSAPELVQSLLEQRQIKVTYTVEGPDGKKKSVQDLEATLAAQAKAEAIQERFQEWLWEDPDRARRLQKRYNEQFNSIVLRKYDGSARQFEGMAESWTPRVHQRNAVERIVNEPTALLGHVVGAGKTAEMVIGAAELRRLGMARKPAIVVPNHMLEQFTREYLEIYPQARLLAAGSEDLQGDKRREFVSRAATGDWDAVIVTQGAFESIPMSREEQEAYIDREMATMRAQLEQAEQAALAAAQDYGATDRQAQQRTVKKMEAALLRAEEALRKKLDKQKDVGVSFEQTGIDYLFVDEAHGYSNLRVLSNIQGAGNVGSDRATDLHMKLEYLRKTSRSGRVATFATGTPIRNTVTQAYVMQRFLRPDLLEEAGITGFDQWAATFGQTVDEMELKPEGSGFRQTTRFAKFRNVPELLKQFHTFADIKLAEDLNLPTPNLEGGKAQIVTVPSSEALRDYIKELGERAEEVRAGHVEPEDDNMLKISGDGRKAALSMALVGGEHEPGKIETAADRIATIWEQNKDRVYSDPETGEDDPIPGALQIVFLDLGTPTSDGWNGYDALKAELVKRGLDPDSVRYIHEAKNDAQKAELFAAARSGRISVLIGSSEKMGVGTNIQKRAVHLHHLDAPWRPADVEQRDGRIMRQGNWNTDIGISRYVTEGSFDAYMWQTLERKAKFINQIMKGSLDVREIEDIGDTAMSYAEIKALATGNPDILEKAKTDTALQKLERLARTHNRVQSNLKSDIQTTTANAATWESFAAQYDAAIPQRIDTRGDAFSMTVNGQRYAKRQDAADAFRGRLMGILDRDRWGDAPQRDLGTIGGFTVTGQVIAAPGGRRDVIIRFSGIPGEVTRLTQDDIRGKVDPQTGVATVNGFGLVTRLESALESFEAKRDRLLQSAAEARIEVGRMEERVGQEFPRAAELAALRVKAERLNLKIERASRREAGEEIPFDPLIDSDQYDSPLVSDNVDVAPEDFGAETGADRRRAAEERAEAQKALVIVDGRVVVRPAARKVAA